MSTCQRVGCLEAATKTYCSAACSQAAYRHRIHPKAPPPAFRELRRVCACGCGETAAERSKYAAPGCRVRAFRARHPRLRSWRTFRLDDAQAAFVLEQASRLALDPGDVVDAIFRAGAIAVRRTQTAT